VFLYGVCNLLQCAVTLHILTAAFTNILNAYSTTLLSFVRRAAPNVIDYTISRVELCFM